jgi:hypothetical protein
MNTREDRMTMMKQAQTQLRKVTRRDPGDSDLDPAKFGVALREVALRAHHLVRASDGPARGTNGSAQELRAVHAEIVHLQKSLGGHRMSDLATYVSALKERVEECLV